MLILKSFIRKKTTKIYIMIFCVICASIMTMFAFSNYYTKIIDELFQKNSLMIISSKTDYYKELKKSNPTQDVESIVLLKPNKKINTIKSLPEYIDGVLVGNGEYNQDSLSEISWNVLILPKFDSVLVLSGSKYNISLQDNEVALGIREENYLGFQEDIKVITGEQIGFYLEEKPVNFVINKFFSSQWPIILVSDNIYNQFIVQSQLHSYKALVNNDVESRKLIDEFKKTDTSKEFQAIVETTYNNEDGNSVERFIGLSQALTFISYVVIIIFVIIFVIIIKNIINDNKKNILLEKKIGYSNWQIKKNIFLQLICFGLLSLIFSYILSIVLNCFINYTFELNLDIINFFIGLVIYIIMLIIFMFIGLTIKVRINDN
ncbi:MAG: hypothetical protein PHE29_08070 [Tissierellia bacterium]|nr:hypothetical protein [Tissierellia bacterium]